MWTPVEGASSGASLTTEPFHPLVGLWTLDTTVRVPDLDDGAAKGEAYELHASIEITVTKTCCEFRIGIADLWPAGKVVGCLSGHNPDGATSIGRSIQAMAAMSGETCTICLVTDRNQMILSAGFPARVGSAIVAFDRAEQHMNNYSVWVRISSENTAVEREMFKGDMLELDGDEQRGRWVLTGFRDAAGAGVHRPDGEPPTTMVFRRVRPGEVGND